MIYELINIGLFKPQPGTRNMPGARVYRVDRLTGEIKELPFKVAMREIRAFTSVMEFETVVDIGAVLHIRHYRYTVNPRVLRGGKLIPN